MGLCTSNLTEDEDEAETFHASYASADGLVDYALQDTPLHAALREELLGVEKIKGLLGLEMLK